MYKRQEEHRGEWQDVHVRAEALRVVRGTGIKWDQLEDASTRLVATALNMCVSLAPPDDGISEPDVLRRADGTSVYRVTGSTPVSYTHLDVYKRQ